MDRTTATASYTMSGATAAGGFFSLNEWALLLGILFTALTFAVNWWYQKRKRLDDLEMKAIELRLKEEHNAREREYHAARMAALRPSDEVSGD